MRRKQQVKSTPQPIGQLAAGAYPVDGRVCHHPEDNKEPQLIGVDQKLPNPESITVKTAGPSSTI
jgi:hypothetical protein